MGLKSGGNTPGLFGAENGVMNITNNDPSKPVFKVSLQTDYVLPVQLASFDINAYKKDVRLAWSTLAR